MSSYAQPTNDKGKEVGMRHHVNTASSNELGFIHDTISICSTDSLPSSSIAAPGQLCAPMLPHPPSAIVVPFHLDDPPPALSVMTSYDSLRLVYRPAYI
jgi:hypothetical protein